THPGTEVPFPIALPAPTLERISPAAAIAGSASTAVSLTGTGFAAVSEVSFDGAPLSSTLTSPTELSATLPRALLRTAGAHALLVVNPGPGGGASEARTFSVDNPRPVAGAIAPERVLIGTATLALALEGSGFVASSRVLANG